MVFHYAYETMIGFSEHIAKIFPKNYLPLLRIHSVMTSMTMLTQIQNPTNFVRI